ncbi:hypothetical protein QBC40DRAFT_331706 [Triangularia verruculosa]|uniref:DUF7587 domain-containing protein n=1 Tax=Triangularia verruculosa TaxID=2587418 RepID=A0AAN7ATT6_9PEZI|nr:hypothetical protein QBC40DRAFT_331706 [Triangularia verruculosa]
MTIVIWCMQAQKTPIVGQQKYAMHAPGDKQNPTTCDGSGLAIDLSSFQSLRQEAVNRERVGHDNDKLYHVYDDLSQTPYHGGLGIHAGVPEQPDGGPRRVTAKSLINHLNWRHRSPTPYISLWDDWAKAEKEVERRLKNPEVFSSRTKTSTPRGAVKVAVVSRDRLLENGTFAFNLEEYLNRPAHKQLLAALQAKKTPISPKECECNGGSTGHLQAETQLRWYHVAPHVVKKSFLAPDGSAKIPTSKTQRKKQLGGTMRRLRRELPRLFNRDSPALGRKLYQALLVVGSMSDPIWRTVAPERILKAFQRSMISIYRKTMLKQQLVSVEHAASHQHLAILKAFTSWLIWEGTITLLDLEVKGQMMSDFRAENVVWSIRDDRLHTDGARP